MQKLFYVGLVLHAGSLAQAAPPPGAHRSTEPYRVSRPAPSNRAGSAALFARALMYRDGNTLLEASTAPFETLGAAAGSLTRVQVKTFASSGVLTTDNYKEMFGPSFARNQAGVYYGQRVQFQAHVVGLDGARTDVVAVDTSARRLPDLHVASLALPSTARPGLPAVVRATVRELNGDTGARADCVLRSDGVEIDRAPNVWVDAGGNVGCMFEATFDTPGVRTLQVEVASVAPADWNAANNAASGTLTVETPESSFHPAFAGVISFQEHQTRFQRIAWTNASPAEGYEAEWNDTSDGWTQQEFFAAYPKVRLEFPISHFSLTLDRDGVARTWRYENLAATWLWGGPETGGGCTVHQDTTSDADRVAWLQICTGWSPTNEYSSTVYSRSADDVLYVSSAYERHWSGTPDNTTSSWYWNDTRATRSGEYVAPGTRYAFTGEQESGGQLYRSAIDLTVESVNLTHRDPPDGMPACTVDDWGGGTNEWCMETTLTRTGAQGFGHSIQ